jgi:hypothetical protein
MDLLVGQVDDFHRLYRFIHINPHVLYLSQVHLGIECGGGFSRE